MWQYLKNLYKACLFFLGVKPKLLPRANAALPVEPSIDDNGWIEGLRDSLIEPIISDRDLDKAIYNFLNKTIPKEYKNYLRGVGSLVGGWLIISNSDFRCNRHIVAMALPVVQKKLRAHNIRAEDRSNGGYIWINASDVAKAVKTWKFYNKESLCQC